MNRRSENRIDPAFSYKGHRGFEPEDKRFSSVARASPQWNECDAVWLPAKTRRTRLRRALP